MSGPSALDVLHALRLEDGGRWGEAAAAFQVADAEAILAPDGPTSHYVTRPRGGSKTSDVAGMILAWLAVEAPLGARACVVASSADQAAILIDAAGGFVSRTPELRGTITVENERIAAPNGAWCRVLTADVPAALLYPKGTSEMNDLDEFMKAIEESDKAEQHRRLAKVNSVKKHSKQDKRLAKAVKALINSKPIPGRQSPGTLPVAAAFDRASDSKYRPTASGGLPVASAGDREQLRHIVELNAELEKATDPSERDGIGMELTRAKLTLSHEWAAKAGNGGDVSAAELVVISSRILMRSSVVGPVVAVDCASK